MKLWTLDFETYWDTQYSLSKMTTDAYVLDPRFEVQGLAVRPPGGGYLYFTPEFIPRLLASIPWGEVGIICHNTAFDGFILRHHYRTPAPKLWLDTLSMARFCMPGRERVSLANVAKYLGLPPKGDETVRTRGKRNHEFTMAEKIALARYAKHDTYLTWQAFNLFMGYQPPVEHPPIMYPEGMDFGRPGFTMPFPVSELRKVDLTLRMFLEPRLYLDADRLRNFHAETVARKQRLLEACGLGTRDALMSNEKFAAALQALGVDPPTKVSPKTGKVTWAFSKRDPDFNELLEHDDEQVQALVEARLEIKSTGDQTRTERLMLVADAGRPWPVLLNFCGAKQTNRLSGGNKQNPQNLRRGGALRDSIIAPPGKKIVVVDSSQIEARTLGAEAGQMDLVEAFRRGDDTYAMLAEKIYGRPIHKKTDPMERQVGKTGRLGLGYGMGPPKFQLALKTDPIMPISLELETCEQVVQVYRRVDCPRIPEFWDTCEYAIRLVHEGVERDFGWFRTTEQGFVLPNGFLIEYPGLHFGEHKGKKGWYYLKRGTVTSIYGAKATENLTQAIARNIVFEQLEQCMRAEYRSVFQHDWVLMSHDEGVFVCPEDKAEALEKFAVQQMHIPPAWTPVQIPVAAEGGIGDRYGEAK